MNYEILYIIPAKYSETEIQEIDKKILSILKECGASVVKTDNWGKKKLAYQIKQYRYGYYTLVIFFAETDVVKKITQKLNINQDIIRFQIVKEIKQLKRVKKIKTEPKIEKVKEEDKKIEDKKSEKIETKDTEEKEKKIEKNKDNKKNPQAGGKEKKSEKKDLSIDELDEKLDKLLNDAI
ncbi:MAG: 30S ribosomal protein S6 [Patescibacteria group bacterium]|nr:30S ribosomal protein S6 [Patescibacteria group bacterium]